MNALPGIDKHWTIRRGVIFGLEYGLSFSRFGQRGFVGSRLFENLARNHSISRVWSGGKLAN